MLLLQWQYSTGEASPAVYWSLVAQNEGVSRRMLRVCSVIFNYNNKNQFYLMKAHTYKPEIGRAHV